MEISRRKYEEMESRIKELERKVEKIFCYLLSVESEKNESITRNIVKHLK